MCEGGFLNLCVYLLNLPSDMILFVFKTGFWFKITFRIVDLNVNLFVSKMELKRGIKALWHIYFFIFNTNFTRNMTLYYLGDEEGRRGDQHGSRPDLQHGSRPDHLDTNSSPDQYIQNKTREISSILVLLFIFWR